MIPQRIAVKGFLCYRDRQEVCFDGPSLWMLSGPNGSGKSTLFDAVTYALFGHHRAGQKNARELVNKNADALEVEFDFQLDGGLYQARRTLRRQSNRATRQLRQWRGDAWEEVAGTDSEEGFGTWVREHLGMTYETFTASVLLLQGKAEKLLDADPRERRKVLGNVVGLDRYERLFTRADERRKELAAEVKVLQYQLDGLPEVSRAALKEAKQRVAEADTAHEAAGVEVERLRSLSLALPWLRRLHRERAALRQAMARRNEARTGEAAAAQRLETAQAEQAPRRARYEAATLARVEADRAATRAATLVEEARKRLTALTNLPGAKTCRACGQPLSPEHLASERARLEREQATATEAHNQALAARRAAAEVERALALESAQGDEAVQTARAELADSQYRQKEAARDAERAGRECTHAYGELTEPYRSLVGAEPAADWTATTYPTADDLRELQGSDDALEVDQIRRQLDAAQREQALCADKLNQTLQEHERLTERHKQRQTLRKKYLAVSRRHNQQQLLAELLGPKRLQLFLVRRAERGIVAYANAILDRLSGGQLYLRLRGEGDGEEEVDRALDLEAFDRAAAGHAPFDVRLLSGSQRFRVAVSLALGIGQYASRRHRSIETVIIDEGFGCLDREGRQAMIQELQNLRGHLRCILLVSHQEEFADAFGDGYRFELADGSTRVTRVQR